MGGLVRVCLRKKLPKEGEVREMRAGRRKFCVARLDGEIAVVDGLCPHKDLPLSDGYIDKGRVVCPWHGWTFDLKTGEQHKGEARVRVFPAAIVDGELLVTISPGS
jgi:nitrite reductase (NADH) small subunit